MGWKKKKKKNGTHKKLPGIYSSIFTNNNLSYLLQVPGNGKILPLSGRSPVLGTNYSELEWFVTENRTAVLKGLEKWSLYSAG